MIVADIFISVYPKKENLIFSLMHRKKVHQNPLQAVPT